MATYFLHRTREARSATHTCKWKRPTTRGLSEDGQEPGRPLYYPRPPAADIPDDPNAWSRIYGVKLGKYSSSVLGWHANQSDPMAPVNVTKGRLRLNEATPGDLGDSIGTLTF